MAEYVLGTFEQWLILQNSDLSLFFLLNFKDVLLEFQSWLYLHIDLRVILSWNTLQTSGKFRFEFQEWVALRGREKESLITINALIKCNRAAWTW